ncbi:MAG: endonuclease MutS2 [Lachnospiraceae bacterium]|nr:endonuclease MutS2 [Lachnospiraceae bacterium]
MNEKVLHTLEFDKIINILADCAGSEPGKSMCLGLRPSHNLEWITRSQEETSAALSRLFKSDRLSFGANKDIRGLIKTLEIGRTISAGELLSIARLLECCGEISRYGVTGKEDEETDALSDYFLRLNPLPSLSGEILRCIISEDEISDDASGELKSIRKSFAIINGRIHAQLTSMVNSTHRTYLQDAVITMRGNRYCIPVKAEYKSQVPGMIHDQSSSGSTLFIEPASVVNLNNELKELELKEREEIERILSALSGKAAQYGDILAENQKTLTHLDFIFAKAKYALRTNATMPIFNDELRIRLRQARHPLLDAKKAVPIDVRLGEDFDLLIVTGPNTGGKTVSLKTVGLLTLMGQAGLHIPALDRSELGLFDEIYADIGDEQSIEQSLSTFSAHMTSIVDILSKADEKSLCLFDELGAGTDPTEGAALAISILDFLHQRGIRSMATTHYSELKIYALSTSYVENASCEFDVESLRPTYRLLIGIPGKSNAFAISRKLGLSEEIIESARQHISTEDESFENVISDLEKQRIEMEKERRQIEEYKKEVESLKNEIESKQEKLDSQRERMLREAREEARDILKEAKDVADETIRAFQKQGTSMSIQTMEKKRKNVREKISEKEAALSAGKKTSSPEVKTIALKDAVPGTSVRILSMNIEGTITVRPDSRGNVSVQCGIITSKVNISDLVEVKKEPEKKTYNRGAGKMNIGKASTVSAELNVIGLTVDEAVAKVDKYLDDACLCHLSKVRIVHGKGTGALRSGIHAFLRGCSHVSGFHLAQYGEGDAGVTIVEL